MGIKPKNIDILTSKDIKLIIISGVAGTGKTLIALAVALNLKFKGIYDKVLVFIREIGVGGDSYGFLPGNEKDKISPYMMPFRLLII